MIENNWITLVKPNKVDYKISDNKKFETLMNESRELAKKNWKGSGDSSVNKIWFEIKDRLGPSEFLGYETDYAEGKILSL